MCRAELHRSVAQGCHVNRTFFSFDVRVGESYCSVIGIRLLMAAALEYRDDVMQCGFTEAEDQFSRSTGATVHPWKLSLPGNYDINLFDSLHASDATD